MPHFSETAAAALAGRTIRAGLLAFLDFTSLPIRVWMGHGPLLASGQTWSGLGELASIDGLERPLGDTASQATLKLSGVLPGIVAETLAAATEVKGRNVTVYVQFFDADTLAPLDDPYAIYAGTMDVMRITATKATSRTVEVTTETVFTRRSTPAHGYLSDRDQEALFPGDRGLIFMASMAAKTVIWPPDLSSDEYAD